MAHLNQYWTYTALSNGTLIGIQVPSPVKSETTPNNFPSRTVLNAKTEWAVAPYFMLDGNIKKNTYEEEILYRILAPRRTDLVQWPSPTDKRKWFFLCVEGDGMTTRSCRYDHRKCNIMKSTGIPCGCHQSGWRWFLNCMLVNGQESYQDQWLQQGQKDP